MRGLKVLTGYLALIFLMLGCDESGSNVITEITSCILSGITETNNGVSTSTAFFYNDKDKLDSEITAGQKTRFFYDAMGNITSSSSPKDNFTYTYDSIFLTGSLQVRNGVNFRKVIYKYTLGQMTRMESYTYINPSSAVLESVTTYEYPSAPSRNYSNSTFTPVTGPVVSTAYEYDNKINPLQLLKFPTIEPDNNVISTIETSGSSNTTTLYTYAYNTINYPLSKTASTGKKVTTYTYDCK